MARRKLCKSKRKWKNKKDKKDKSKINSCVKEDSVRPKCEEFSEDPYVFETQKKCLKSTGRKERTSKQVHFAVLPHKYEPLEEDRASDTASEENYKTNQEKYKRFRKNFSKALHYTWKCLVVGLQSFSTSYSGPLSSAATLVPDIQRTRPKA